MEERGADFFSNLVFKEVSARHSGLYTCVASNTAAKVNYTAELVVKGNRNVNMHQAPEHCHEIVNEVEAREEASKYKTFIGRFSLLILNHRLVY